MVVVPVSVLHHLVHKVLLVMVHQFHIQVLVSEEDLADLEAVWVLMVLPSVDFNNLLFRMEVWVLVALVDFHNSLAVHPLVEVYHLVVVRLVV